MTSTENCFERDLVATEPFMGELETRTWPVYFIFEWPTVKKVCKRTHDAREMFGVDQRFVFELHIDSYLYVGR